MTSVPVLFPALLSPWKIKYGSITNTILLLSIVLHVTYAFHCPFFAAFFYKQHYNLYWPYGEKVSQTTIVFSDIVLKLCLFFKILIRPQNYVHILKVFLSFALSLMLKGPDPTVTGKENFQLSLSKVASS